MRRLITALVLLGILAGLSLWDLHQVQTLSDQLCALTALSVRALREGDRAAAISSADTALRLWDEAEGYTHIFIRHSEIDSTADALFELKAAVLSGDVESAQAMQEMAAYHLMSIRTMEEVSLGSVF